MYIVGSSLHRFNNTVTKIMTNKYSFYNIYTIVYNVPNARTL